VPTKVVETQRPRNPLSANFLQILHDVKIGSLVSWWMMGDSEWFQVLRRASFGREGSDMASASHRDVTERSNFWIPEMTQIVSFQAGVKHLYIHLYIYIIYIYTIYIYIWMYLFHC